jgi:hypothetical protein
VHCTPQRKLKLEVNVDRHTARDGTVRAWVLVICVVLPPAAHSGGDGASGMRPLRWVLTRHALLCSQRGCVIRGEDTAQVERW